VGSPWNSISYKTLGGCLALLLLAASASHAHVEIEKQIEDLTTRIGKDPKNAALYLRRGELYRVHRDWGAALEDYKRAAKLDPSLSAVDLCLARMRLESGQPGEARIAADRFLQARPEHIEGLVTRARALVKLGEGRLAADDLTRAIELSRPPKSPLPEYYLERARALAEEGEVDQALSGLDEGIGRLGPIITLELLAMDLELKHKRHDAALRRVGDTLASWPRKETWLVKRGEILEAVGRLPEAREAFGEARQALESLPANRRKTKALAQLEAEIEAALERLSEGH